MHDWVQLFHSHCACKFNKKQSVRTWDAFSTLNCNIYSISWSISRLISLTFLGTNTILYDLLFPLVLSLLMWSVKENILNLWLQRAWDLMENFPYQWLLKNNEVFNTFKCQQGLFKDSFNYDSKSLGVPGEVKNAWKLWH